jgi:cytochrome b561
MESYMNEAQSYTATAKWLHWLIAILIIIAWQLGSTMVEIEGLTPTKLRYFNWHKWLGVTIFAFVLVRLIWRATHAAPASNPNTPAWQEKLAALTHVAMYALMVAIPVTGYLHSLAAGYPVVYLGLIPLPEVIGPDKALKELLEKTHEILADGLAVLFAAHVVAALKHHFFDRDDVLRRMLPSRR